MDQIENWIRTILIYKIVSSIFVELAVGEKNRKLIRFFSGIIFMVLITKPILTLLYDDQYLIHYFEKTRALEDLQDMNIIVEEGDLKRKQAIYDSYTNVIKIQIEEFVHKESLILDEFRVEYDDLAEDTLKIQKIYLFVSRKYDENQAIKRAYDESHGNAVSLEEIQIKTAISQFYRIEENKIYYEER